MSLANRRLAVHRFPQRLSAKLSLELRQVAREWELRYRVAHEMNSGIHGALIGQILVGSLFLTSCVTTAPRGIQQAKIAVQQQIAAEPPGDYYVGRRYYKPDFKFWGYIRRPGQPWSTAQLVMLNENEKLAPDREQLNFGSDNNYEYRLYGYFSGQTVYEPASNGFYPEFVLKRYELVSTHPPAIFRSQLSGSAQAATTRYTIEKPQY